MEQCSNIYIGFTEQKEKIWQIEFELENSPANSDCHYFVQKFKIISIEDYDGKIYRKDSNYAIGCNYYLKKHPLKTYLNKTNMMFYDFYNKKRQEYEKYTGQITEYHSDGSIALQYFLNNGILEGNYIAIDKYGNELESTFFVNGKRHGKTVYNAYYSNNIKIYSFECTFNMNIMTSWNFEFAKDQAIIEFSLYFREKGKYNKNTNKYYYVDDKYEIEWTINNTNIDICKIKISEEYFKNNYLKYILDIPYNIQKRYKY